jgi:hypothetical protein
VTRGLGPDGKIMHAEIVIGSSHFFVNDAKMGMKGPRAMGGSPASFWLYVEDSDALFTSRGCRWREGADQADGRGGAGGGTMGAPSSYSACSTAAKQDSGANPGRTLIRSSHVSSALCCIQEVLAILKPVGREHREVGA